MGAPGVDMLDAGMAFLGPRAMFIALVGKACLESFPLAFRNFGFLTALGTFGLPPLA